MIDGGGGYLMPGFINAHAHIPEADPDYAFRLWLAHGITSIREVGSPSLKWLLALKAQSEANTIAAPRIEAYPMFPYSNMVRTPEQAREWARAVADKGADGIKLRSVRPVVLEAIMEEVNRLGLGTAFHHDRRIIGRINALDSARLGVDSMEHQLALPETMFTERTVQDFPARYTFGSELDRIRGTAQTWNQAAKPGSQRWNEVIEELVDLDFTIVPTLAVYEANRDAMRARSTEYFNDYALPMFLGFWEPNPRNHFSHFYDWTTADEVAWKDYFRQTYVFLNDFKNAGGRVVPGADEGFLYTLYGFGYIRELELFQEAGFHPLEVIRSATLDAAELLGQDDRLGTIELGKTADLVLTDENPLQNFKVLYGHGHTRYDFKAQANVPVGRVVLTIKDGIVYDARALLNEVRNQVLAAKTAEQSE